MPTATRVARRSRETMVGGKHAGSRLRRDPRQETLTQIGYITRLDRASPELDLEYDDDSRVAAVTPSFSPELGSGYEQQEQQRPRKRRKRGPASLSPRPSKRDELGGELTQSTSHSSPGPNLNARHELPVPKSGKLPTTAGQDASDPAPRPANDRILMPPPNAPKTPSRTIRKVVPSSQSPDTTPLSIRRTMRYAPQMQRSPLKEKSNNSRFKRRSNSKKGPNPFLRFKVEDTYTQEQENDDAVSEEKEQGRIREEHVSKLNLGVGISKPYPAASSRQEIAAEMESRQQDRAQPDLQTPADAKRDTQEAIYVESSSQVDLSPNVQLRTHPLQGSFSQATTQEPTQVNSFKRPPGLAPAPEQVVASKEVSSEKRKAVRLDKTYIPSSQITTQLPTQYLHDDSMQILLDDDAETDTNIHADPGREPELLRRRRITSSQATTVIPSSDPLSDQEPHTSSQGIKSRTSVREDMESPREQQLPLGPPSSAHAKTRWEWHGKDWTDSQLLPESLMNFAIPSLPVPASQESLTSLLDEDEAQSPGVSRKGATRADAHLTAKNRSAREEMDQPRKRIDGRAQTGIRKKVKE